MHGISGAHRFNCIVSFLAIGLCSSLVRAEETSPATIAGEPPANVDLRPLFEQWGLERSEQGGRPTCSVFTIVGALEFAVAKQQQSGERLSVEFLNWAANQKRRNPRDGGFFSEMWSGFAAFGICKEQVLPYRPEFDSARSPDPEVLAAARSKLALKLKFSWIKKWNVNTGLTEAEFLGLKRTLNQGWPVCGGLRWPKQEQWKDDMLQMCPPEAVFDGHSVLLVGYRDDAKQPGGGAFIFRNTNRGGRDGFMPYAFARAYMNDAAWIQSAHKAQADDSQAGTEPQRGDR